ncbi:formamidopyrimidine-DNA glycosylase isoform X3 [Brachypodium distachyon]|uniref:DNA-(apurinic or apyrimidinic site) lyase n=2 Tax=Brachypodium distachyon TaxID=15368 RepID=A0A0Q3JCE5_BRADI|nr:formamidopyrimidine-DNA glycosylase isoform X3 [Brachypodium distachyon]KQJ96000.1 hypothetical protein BRADI_3g20150v3 [Brachypodium distachyon]|eukprot:XP_014755486.1 formamidopyrimidine-DNA glycosylase isoform X3 [Brachypodium distachyon]
MPELPEVEAARLALEEHCVGKRIVRCSAADDTKVIDGIAPSQLEAALVGRTIAAARRKGKNLWLVLDSPPFPSFQFGMAGAIYIKGVELSKYKRSAVSPTEEWPSKYSKLFVESIMSGIGNWIADEVLYLARIHPMQTASKISKEKYKALHRCIKEVIEKSVEVGADSSEFPQDWIFHSREKKPGKAFVDGKKIDFITVGGRTSAYVPELQMLDGADAVAENRCKRRKEKLEKKDDTTLKKGPRAPKENKKTAKAMTVDDEEEDNPVKQRAKAAKPTKRGRKPMQVAKASSNKAVSSSTHDNEADEEDQDDEEASKPAKRGRKQPATGSSNKDDCSPDTGNDGKVEAKPGKRRGQKQPAAEVKSLPDNEETAVPAKRPQRKKR